MLRVLTVLGTRPEIIRLSRLIPRLDRETTHTLLDTGQNADPLLSAVFFEQLRVRQPDIRLRASGDLAAQLATIFRGVADAIAETRPDRLVILGDTNSGLAAIIAARAGVPVVHLEAGNRCFDWRSPEEVNRRAIDHVSTWLLPYTHGSREHLLREGIPSGSITVIGNPIYEVLDAERAAIDRSRVRETCEVERGAYVLLTLHRAETVDDPDTLAGVLEAVRRVSIDLQMPVLFPVHPRTRQRLSQSNAVAPQIRLPNVRLPNIRLPNIRLIDPLGFADFVRLERDARLVISDSGTVQEECAILGVPCVVARDFTERPETIACGAAVLGGRTPASLMAACAQTLAREGTPAPPPEYLVPDVSAVAARVILGGLPSTALPGGHAAST